MNSASQFLYLVQILSNLGIITIIALLIGGCSLIFTLVFAAMEQDFKYSTFDENPLWGVSQNIGIVLSIFVVIGLFVPSKETMYIIAASQIGEQIIQLEEVQAIGGEAGGLAKDTIELLRQQISEQLAEKPVEAPKPD